MAPLWTRSAPDPKKLSIGGLPDRAGRDRQVVEVVAAAACRTSTCRRRPWLGCSRAAHDVFESYIAGSADGAVATQGDGEARTASVDFPAGGGADCELISAPLPPTPAPLTVMEVQEPPLPPPPLKSRVAPFWTRTAPFPKPLVPLGLFTNVPPATVRLLKLLPPAG